MLIDAMHHHTPWIPFLLLIGSLSVSTAARGNDDDDALALQGTPPAESAADSPLRLAVELGFGRLESGVASTLKNTHRAALDLRYSTRIDSSWQFSLSNRLDDYRPTEAGQGSTVNSLREAFLAWQQPGAATLIDIGRVNFRQGPGFGYNPTDYFRTCALRTLPTADPVALRELRMGTYMLRAGRLSASDSLFVALAPKLGSAVNQLSCSNGPASTNVEDRALLNYSNKLTPWFSGQGSMLLERGSTPKFGLSATALLSDSAVAYAEWSTGKVQSVLSQVQSAANAPERAQQAVAGLTYSLPTSTAVTFEAEYNGAGLDRAGWDAVLNQGADGYRRYLQVTLPHQELGTRRAWLLYVSQKGLGLKQLDLTGFVRINATDRSHLVWAELRYHWTRFDGALQWQRAVGDARSEYGALPYRQIVQLVASAYF